MKPRSFILFAALVALVLAGAVRAEPPPRLGDANKDAREAAISADGRFVAFSSNASDLVPGDINYDWDVFVYDRETKQTSIVSRRPDGVQGNNRSYEPAISADGRYVAFRTWASNLLAGQPGVGGVLLKDRQTGEISLISRSSDGASANDVSGSPSVSADGRYVAFGSNADNLVGDVPPTCDGDQGSCYNVYVHDRETGETTLISRNANGVSGDNDSWSPSISADGRYVAFHSDAGNLLEGNSTGPTTVNAYGHVYVYDREAEQMALVSRNTAGEPAVNGSSQDPSISGDGRLIAFVSGANNLAPTDPDSANIFVHNRETGETVLVSRGTAGAPGNGASWGPAMAAGGLSVSFGSAATNLVDGDTNGVEDIFVHDLATGQTTLVSRSWSGAPGDGDSWGPAISGDGQLIAFETYAANLGEGGAADGLIDIALHDRATGETTYLTARPPTLQGNSESRGGSVSADGRFVAFESYASNLVPGDANGRWDIFVRDMRTGQTALVGRGSQATGESRDPAISADGRFVAFESTAEPGGSLNWNSNVFVHDRQTGETTLISRPMVGLPPADGSSQNPALSADGRFVAFESYADNLTPDDPKGWPDLFIYDRQTGTMTWIPRSPAGDEEWEGPCCASISADGRYVAFAAWVLYYARLGGPYDDNVQQVFVYDRTTGETTTVSLGESRQFYGHVSGAPSISDDGRYVTFHSNVGDLVSGDTNDLYDIFVYDLQTDEIALVSRHSDGAQGNAGSLNPSLSADGRYVAFQSDADNLVDGDGNHLTDIFIHDRQIGQTTLASRDMGGAPGRGNSFEPSLAAGGGHVAFWSDADLVTGDANGLYDVFLFDRAAERPWLVSGIVLGPHRAFAPVVNR